MIFVYILSNFYFFVSLSDVDDEHKTCFHFGFFKLKCVIFLSGQGFNVYSNFF